VTVAVSDNDGGTGTRTAQVTVWSGQQGIEALSRQVSDMTATPPLHPLANATDALNRGDRATAGNQMEAFIHQVQAQVNGRRLTTAQGEALTAFARRVIASIDG